MTKEEYLELDLYNAFNDRKIKEVLDKFFSQNICIPKGTNRHQYADVIHQWIEGAVVLTDNSTKGNYIGRVLEECSIMLNETNYRIKPSEPVYEWQWALVVNVMGEIGRTVFMTQYEFDKNFPPEQGVYWSIDLTTKRVRQ